MRCVGMWRSLAVSLIALLFAACFASAEAAARPDDAGCAPAPRSKFAVNVKAHGALGDGATDDTAAIQAVIDRVGGTGGTVFVPDGTYLVDAVGPRRLSLKSDTTLKLAPGAILQAIPNDAQGYSVLLIAGVANVSVVGGTLEGDRRKHTGETGEWGMGIRIEGGASHITISGVTSREMWGDGFYVEGARNVVLCRVTADHNRRQGLSIIAVDGLIVKDSIFKNTWGTRPSSGIDLEPDLPSQAITNVRIEDSQFLDNDGAGLLVDAGKGPVSKVAFLRNVFTGNPRAIKLKHVPVVATNCGNQLDNDSYPWNDFSAFVETVKFMVAPSDCDATSSPIAPDLDRTAER
jgi:hypothetical protein